MRLGERTGSTFRCQRPLLSTLHQLFDCALPPGHKKIAFLSQVIFFLAVSLFSSQLRLRREKANAQATHLSHERKQSVVA